MRKHSSGSFKGKRLVSLTLAGLMLFLSLNAPSLPVYAEEAPEETAVETEAPEALPGESAAEIAAEPGLTVDETEETDAAVPETEDVVPAAEEEEEPALTAASEDAAVEETEEEPVLSEMAARSFQSMLESFPESYRPYLQRLHDAHPNWTFTPEYLGIDWDAAVYNESDYGVSLVEGSSRASWKSTMDSVFDADHNTWKGLDGSRWVQASVAVTEYYMDPRVYLNDNGDVFAFLDHSYNANMASAYENGLTAMLRGTAMSGNLQDDDSRSYVSVFLEAGRTYGVNPMVLAAMVIIEQGSNLRGDCVSGTFAGYEGYYNYFNVGAYAANGMDAHQRGLWYASGQGSGQTSYGRPWNTRYAAIMGGASYYAQNYVQQGQDTLYYKRFNVGPSTAESQRFRHQYMTNIQGCSNEAVKLSRAYSGQDLALNFVIPVYDNMPASAVTRPSSNTIGSGDVSTSGRVVRTNSRFDPDVTPAVIANPTATLNTSLAVADGYIRGAACGTTAGGIVSALGVRNGSVTVYNSLGSVITGNRRLGTGCSVFIYNNAGEVQEADYVVMTGDLNGDGQISAIDLLRVQKGLLGVTALSGPVYQAADINGDGQVSALDLLKVQKHLLGVSSIG